MPEEIMPKLQDRVAIVTGGGHGIGRAYCEGVAEEGGKPVVVDVDGAAAQRVAAQLSDTGADALALEVDVSREDQTQDMAKAVIERYGRIDGLVNNAAVFHSVPLARFSGIEDLSVEEWERVMSVNVRGVFLSCKAVVPAMKARGYGKIVNISSTTALEGLASFGPYPTSKAAVLGITRGLARDLGAHNITVNSIAPGLTLSLDRVAEDDLRQAQSAIEAQPSDRLSGAPLRAIRRVERPQDLVGAVLFLLSADSDFVSGQTLVVDGGGHMT
jgi:NAD(P)-dependent dehydrogenase (short-subunit alcohol dehydrogenase family)